METYIFNCYSKWIKDREGSIIKQMSRLTIFARILIVSLVVALVGIIVTYILMYNMVIDQIYLLIFLGVEGLIAFITYIYTSRYEVAHSYTSLSQYKGYCKKLTFLGETMTMTKRTSRSRDYWVRLFFGLQLFAQSAE